MRIAFLGLLLFPLVFAACSNNNITEDNSLQKYFDSAGVRGSFGLFDNGQGHFTIYNLARFRDSAYSPAATFTVLSSLVGIETGIIKDENAVIPWDHVPGNKPDCDQDLSLRQAFHYSCDAWFRELAHRISKDTLRKWTDSLGYGTKNSGGPADTLWTGSRLAITSDEQLGLVKKLYFDQLPFYQRTQKIVRGIFEMENNTNYRLSYKTGQGFTNNGHAMAWLIGWVEENKHAYFFVLNLESADPQPDLIDKGMGILKSSLKQLGFFEGKK